MFGYNIIVDGFGKARDNGGALKVLRKMEERVFIPSVVIYNIIVHSLCRDKLMTYIIVAYS